MKSITLYSLIIFFIAINIYGQSKNVIEDSEYKFKLTLSDRWTKTKTEQTAKNDAISYIFEKNDGKSSIMLLAFKVESVKDITDFIYTLEKDMTLNIPSRKSDYTDFDYGIYDGRMAIYKDSEFTETIYYYRTKNSNSSENYTYMLRFITSASFYNSATENEIKNIADTFTVTLK